MSNPARENSIWLYTIAAGFFGILFILSFEYINNNLDLIDIEDLYEISNYSNYIILEIFISGFLLLVLSLIFISVFYVFMDFNSNDYSAGLHLFLLTILAMIILYDISNPVKNTGIEHISYIGINQCLYLALVAILIKPFREIRFLFVLFALVPLIKLIYSSFDYRDVMNYYIVIYLLVSYIALIFSLLFFDYLIKPKFLKLSIRKNKFINILAVSIEFIFLYFCFLSAVYFIVL